MKKYLIVFGVLALAACNGQKAEERGREAANRENEIRQRAVDSMAEVNRSHPEVHYVEHHHSGTTNNSSSTTNENNTNTEPAKKKGMSNTTKGALIGTGAGIITGAATGAAVSEDKGKGAVIGGAVGGAVGSGVGYGVGAEKDRKEKEKNNSGQ